MCGRCTQCTALVRILLMAKRVMLPSQPYMLVHTRERHEPRSLTRLCRVCCARRSTCRAYSLVHRKIWRFRRVLGSYVVRLYPPITAQPKSLVRSETDRSCGSSPNMQHCRAGKTIIDAMMVDTATPRFYGVHLPASYTINGSAGPSRHAVSYE